ncbi:MAG: site-2 protease family protein [Myxococcaceae bacterium]|nr:site-2 protease family protein [Myxococcaceae bacterium]
MFRFRLGSIPVEIHFFHLLISGVFGWSFFVPGLSRLGPPWLAERLADASHPGHGQAQLLGMLAWMLIVFVSVLVHELGHALAYRAFGFQPSIALVSLGGVTSTNTAKPLLWHRSVLVSLAGPFSGLALGVACKGVSLFAEGHSVTLDFFLYWFFVANVFWTVFNLLPVPPMDGGHVLSTVLVRFFGRRGFIAAQGFALLVAVAAVAWGWPDLLFVLLFGLWGFQALRALLEALNEPSPEREASSPLMQTLQRAREELAQGRLAEAQRMGASILERGEGVGPELASRTHHLLGWIAIKEGQGRLALDHFSQVQRQPVEPHALAAAFSLIGDELRALPLWEKAWRDTQDRTVMHEYAGSLIRAGKVEQALRLPGVDPAAAFACAERTLFIRGAYSEAAAMGEAALAHAPSPTIAYDAACAFARARNVADAVRLLHRATELGFRDAAYAASDEDLAPLHGHPSFEAWLAGLRQSASS